MRQVFLWRRDGRLIPSDLSDGPSIQRYLQRLPPAGAVFFFRDPQIVIGGVVDGGSRGEAGGVGQVQELQGHVVIPEEILLGADSYNMAAAQNFDVGI